MARHLAVTNDPEEKALPPPRNPTRSSKRAGRTEFRTNAAGEKGALPYRRKQRLLSAGEHRFYTALVEAVGDRYRVSLKTRLLDVIMPTEGLTSTAGRKISQRHVDFVLYDPATTRVVLAVELDDASHLRRERTQKDTYLDAALAAAGVMVVRFPVYKRYDPARIRRAILASLPKRRTTAMRE